MFDKIVRHSQHLTSIYLLAKFLLMNEFALCRDLFQGYNATVFAFGMLCIAWE
jgi:hypothetical protein